MDVPSRPPEHEASIPDAVVAVSWSPDGLMAVVGGAGGGLWRVDGAGAVCGTLPGHRDGLFQAAWQPDGPWVASAGQDGHARVWDVARGVEVAAIPGGAPWVEQLAWSPSGEWLAVGAGRHLTLWHRERGVAHVVSGHRSTISALAWRPDSRVVGAAAYGGVSLWEATGGAAAGTLPWKTSMLSLAWSPDDRWVVAGTQDLAVQVWPQPFEEGDEMAMSGYAGKVRELAWHRSGRYLATGGGDQITVWDCGGKGPAGTTPRLLEGHVARVTALAYQRRGHLLASGGQDGLAFFWNAGKSSAPLRQSRVGSPVTAMAVSPDDQRLLVGGHDGRLAWLRFPGAA